MRKRELLIRDGLAASDPKAASAIDKNTIRTMFTPLAEKILNQDSGVLASVMPVTACTGASGQPERRFLASRFHISAILSVHEPQEPNLSTHTEINECLLIARRNKTGSRSPTKFINLRRFPRTMEAVGEIVEAVRAGREKDIGSVCEWPEGLVRAGDWSPVQWFDPELARAARSLAARGRSLFAEPYYSGKLGDEQLSGRAPSVSI